MASESSAAKWAGMDHAAWAELDEEWLAGGATHDLERPWGPDAGRVRPEPRSV